jgi:hypothetical protein
MGLRLKRGAKRKTAHNCAVFPEFHSPAGLIGAVEGTKAPNLAAHVIPFVHLHNGGPEGGPMKHNALAQLSAKNAVEGRYADGQGL